jgi:hypothetical protein
MKKILSAAVLALLVGGAHAQVYVGGNLGLAKSRVDCAAGTNCDDTDLGYKVYFGYRDPAYKAFGLELGYFDLGKTKFDAPGTANDREVKAKAAYLAVGLQTDFTQSFGGGVRLGAAYVKATCSGQIGTKPGPFEDTRMAAYIGGNLAYAFTPKLKGVVALDVTQVKCPMVSTVSGPMAQPASRVGLLSVGAEYGF